MKRFDRTKGFTLIEAIVVIIMLAIAWAGIATMESNLFSAETGNDDLRDGMKEFQQCAERILALRRQAVAADYASTIAADFCDDINTAIAVDSSSTTCPTGTDAAIDNNVATTPVCRVVKISSTAAVAPAPISFVLVQQNP